MRKVLMCWISETFPWNPIEDWFKRGGRKGDDQKTQGFSSFFTENCERESRMHLRKDTTSKACPAGNLAGALLQSTISRLFSAFSWGPDGEALYLYFSSLRRVLSFYLYNWYPRFSLIIQYKSFFYCTFSFC